MRIDEEVSRLTDTITVPASPVPVVRPLNLRAGGAVAIESVIWTIDRITASVDWWWAGAISTNPEWERDLVGIGPFVENNYALAYWWHDVWNGISAWDFMTRQLWLHNIILPGRLRWMSLGTLPSNTAQIEVYYHAVDMERGELDHLNAKYGKYRR